MHSLSLMKIEPKMLPVVYGGFLAHARFRPPHLINVNDGQMAGSRHMSGSRHTQKTKQKKRNLIAINKVGGLPAQFNMPGSCPAN
jgi:hypothetical protein